MPRKRFSPEQITATLRQIEVHLAQGKSIALACMEAVDYQFAWSKILVRTTSGTLRLPRLILSRFGY